MKSIRLKDYDYSNPGCYFVTICSLNRRNVFGKIVERNIDDGPEVDLTDVGKIVERAWRSLTDNFIDLDRHVIMPNHVHGIVIIRENDFVGGIQEFPLQNWKLHRRRMLLPKVIGKFKKIASNQYNELFKQSGSHLWQPNYYEHIIRNEKELEKIRNYILDNPRKWFEDIENPNNTLTRKQIKDHYHNLFYV